MIISAVFYAALACKWTNTLQMYFPEPIFDSKEKKKKKKTLKLNASNPPARIFWTKLPHISHQR